jgi:hypothetical protein
MLGMCYMCMQKVDVTPRMYYILSCSSVELLYGHNHQPLSTTQGLCCISNTPKCSPLESVWIFDSSLIFSLHDEERILLASCVD